MTYVASPSYTEDAAGRAANLKQCLETARKRLDETSKSSAAEKEEELVSSAVSAGWDEDEVRAVLGSHERERAFQKQPEAPTFGVVPSSSI